MTTDVNSRALRSPTTIEDVAAKAGVSRSTVSRVINGSKSVSQAAAESVGRAIADLDYVPNRAARLLAARQTNASGDDVAPRWNGDHLDVITGMDDPPARERARRLRALGLSAIAAPQQNAHGDIALNASPEQERVGSGPNDLAFVQVVLCDHEGALAGDVGMTVEISVEGSIDLLRLSNANPVDMEEVGETGHAINQGRLLAVVRPNAEGRLRLSATAAFGSATVEVIAD